ncbi:hypothetical protein BDQ12DRAFT_708264 [Crucibulum laeve]|uniref:SET domain-containing protein n=1 Tax=Crucibulum laeve TaxID=68775 RepID=A0A5C3MFX6_9AGAR|nr:hypothetical protein BDQ12DRAFT_708264 [Crucibulum laeve]
MNEMRGHSAGRLRGPMKRNSGKSSCTRASIGDKIPRRNHSDACQYHMQASKKDKHPFDHWYTPTWRGKDNNLQHGTSADQRGSKNNFNLTESDRQSIMEARNAIGVLRRLPPRMSTEDLKAFLAWFQSHNGTIDTESMDIVTFPAPEGGRGAIAIKDIPEGHTLFTIPRSLTLSTRTSSLPSKFGLDAWKQLRLHEGWAGLILCMMWEAARGPSSEWSEYFAILPAVFDTPMFWDNADLEELKGTSVVEKLGRDDAEKDYNEKVVPAVQVRPDLFAPKDIPTYYSLHTYHIMGSRILSRSFNVEKSELEEDQENTTVNTSIGSGMDVDPQEGGDEHDGEVQNKHVVEQVEEEEEEEEEEEDSSDIAMVPMADMLNAQYEMENAKLFYEETELKMVSTKLIKAGGQIWNTYGDLPNAELLRRYGHVDLLPLSSGGKGNPGDVTEVKADILVTLIKERHPELSPEATQERIDWWLEEGGDDTFILEFDFEIPPALASLTRLLLLSSVEWEKGREKGRPPKPKMDSEILAIVRDALERRLHEYPTTLEEDELMLSESVSLNKRHAIIIRGGEKRILLGTLERVKVQLEKDKASSGTTKNKRKGGDDRSPEAKAKKSRR